MVPVDGKYRQHRDSSIQKYISRSDIIPHTSKYDTYARRIQRDLYSQPRPRNVAWRRWLVPFRERRSSIVDFDRKQPLNVQLISR